MTRTSNNNNNDDNAILTDDNMIITNNVASPDYSYPKTVTQALKSILTDEKVSDIYLKGNDDDGINVVPACKCILASWSPVFRSMLYNDNFIEASSKVININFPTTAIQKLVEFCYTGEIESIEKLKKMNSDEELNDTLDARFLQDTVWLFKAANYYQIKQLERNLKSFLTEIMYKGIKWVSCYVLEEAGANEELVEMSMKVIRRWPRPHLEEDKKSLRCLSARSLSKILQDDNINASELFLFECLQRWTDLEEYDSEKEHTSNHQQPKKKLKLLLQDKSLPSFDKDQRRKEAMVMAKHINLARISQSKLATVVKWSGLIDKEDLLQAYEKQALSFSTHKQRGPFVIDVENALQSVHRSNFAGTIKINVEGSDDELDGTYVLGCNIDGVPAYYKKGYWDSELDEREVGICYDGYDDRCGWMLGLLLKDSIDDFDEIFFFAETEDTKKIPTRGWEAADKEWSDEPVPTFSYNENEI